MGRSTTPTFRLETPRVYCVPTGRYVHHTPAAWHTSQCGSPTNDSLRHYVRDLEASTLAGGCNEHLGACRVLAAQVVHQASGRVVATYAPAAFEVL